MKTMLILFAMAVLVACGAEEVENPPSAEAECERDADCVRDNPCEEARCVAAKCVAETLPDGAACDDGSVCTPENFCQAGECVGQELDLQALLKDLCLVIACDPKEGFTVGFEPDGAACAFGQCAQGVCLPAE